MATEIILIRPPQPTPFLVKMAAAIMSKNGIKSVTIFLKRNKNFIVLSWTEADEKI